MALVWSGLLIVSSLANRPINDSGCTYYVRFVFDWKLLEKLPVRLKK